MTITPKCDKALEEILNLNEKHKLDTLIVLAEELEMKNADLQAENDVLKTMTVGGSAEPARRMLKSLAILRAEVVWLNKQITALQSDGRKLKATINAMKCCANCRHAHYDGMDYECYAGIHGITGDCCQPDLELWELETKGGKKP